jgi:hypothetical protein
MSPRLGVLNNIPFAIEDEGVGAEEDGFDRLEGAYLKAAFEITFINQFGQEEWVVFLSPLLRIETRQVRVGTGLALTARARGGCLLRVLHVAL